MVDFPEPVLPVPRLPNRDDLARALDVAKSFLTPVDPYEAAGKMVGQARSGDYLGAAETGVGALPQTGAIIPGSFAGHKLPSVDALARAKDKFVYHSGTADEIPLMKDYLEPYHGKWIQEVANGAVDDAGELLENSVPLVWMSKDPSWVRSKVARKLGIPHADVTPEQIEEHGHVALVQRKGPDAENIWWVGNEGLGNGPYSNVTNLQGETRKAYDTNLFDHPREPFGVERNEYISSDLVEPMLHLTGSHLVDFLRKTGHLGKSEGGSIGLPYGGSGLPYSGGKEPYTPRKKKKAEGGALMDPVLPIPDRLPNWGDVSKAVDVAKSFLTPPDPYEAAGKMVTQARGGDYGGALETGLSFMPQTGALYQRKLSPQGFYSHGAESAHNLPQETMTVQQARKMLEKAGTKPDEFRWSGFENAYPDPMAKVNRADLVRHFEENAPQLGETVLGGQADIDKRGISSSFARYFDRTGTPGLIGGRETPEFLASPEGIERQRLMDLEPVKRSSKFSQYTLPGGENYREVLTTLPDRSSEVYQLVHPSGLVAREFNTRDEAKQALVSQPRYADHYIKTDRRENGQNYKSSHWDEPNVLAHLRMSERPGNVLHLEELQSDWGQEARKKGIRDQNEAELANLVRQREALSQEALANPHDLSLNDRLNAIHDRIYDLGRGDVGVPDAPYIASTQGWTDLGLKRALYEAAKANAERLAWTPGAEQAARYDLSKQIGKVMYFPEHKNFQAIPLNGAKGISEYNVEPHDLEKYVGKDVAKKLLETEPTTPEFHRNRAHVLEGLDLQVGGEGMKGYYDKILPSRLQALLKRLGVGSPEITPLSVGDKEIPSMAITPEMRERLLKGLPYFASGGEVSAPITGEHTITMDDLIGRAATPASTPGAYTDTGGQKIAAPYVSGMANGYPVYSIPQSGDTAISDALNVARHVGRHKTGTPVYSLAGV